MKVWSKLIAMLTIVALMFVFTACGGDSGANSTPTPTPTPDTTDEPTPAPTEEADLEFDMGGKVIRVAAWWDDLPSADATDESGKRAYQRMKALEEKYNFTFEAVVVPANDISVQFDAAVLANEQFAEIIFMRSEKAASYAAQGQLFPIDTVFDLSQKQFNQSITDKFTIDGKVYAFSTWGNSIESTVSFNKDIFARQGLADPYELVKNKEWTWEKFLEYVDKATVAGAAGGEPEVYGLYGITVDPAISHVLASFGAEYVHRDASGVYSSGLSDENTIKALNFLYDLNTTNPGVYVPVADAPWDDGKKMFAAGKVAMLLGSGVDKNEMTDKFGIVPIPLADGMTEYANVTQSHNVRVMHSSLDPEFAKQIAYVYSKLSAPLVEDPEEAEELERATLENRYWDAESVDIMLELQNSDSKIFNHYEATSVFWDVVSKPMGTAFRGETTVAAVIAAAEQAWEEDIARTNAENAK